MTPEIHQNDAQISLICGARKNRKMINFLLEIDCCRSQNVKIFSAREARRILGVTGCQLGIADQIF